MSQARLSNARALIEAHDYEHARTLLRSLPDDTTARRWLERLDERFPAQRRRSPRAWIFISLAVALLLMGGFLTVRSVSDQFTENAAIAAFYIDCTASVYTAQLQNGQNTNASIAQALCGSSGRFNAHKETILACYRTVGRERFERCVADAGIRNPY